MMLIVEHASDEAGSTPAAGSPIELNSPYGLAAAFLRACGEIEISLQNVLAFLATILIPFVVYVPGAGWTIAIAVAVLVLMWFLVWKMSGYPVSKVGLFGTAVALTLLVSVSVLVAKALWLRPSVGMVSRNQRHGPIVQQTAPGGIGIVGSGNTVLANPPPRDTGPKLDGIQRTVDAIERQSVETHAAVSATQRALQPRSVTPA